MNEHIIILSHGMENPARPAASTCRPTRAATKARGLFPARKRGKHGKPGR